MAHDESLDNTPVSITLIGLVLLCESAIKKHLEALADMEYDELGPLYPEPKTFDSAREAVTEYIEKKGLECTTRS